MRVLLQRVNKASVIINNKKFSSINNGLLVFLGIQTKDSIKDVEYLVRKIINWVFHENKAASSQD